MIKKLYILTLMITATLVATAQSSEKYSRQAEPLIIAAADSSYAAGDYASAAAGYKSVIDAGRVSAALYYNLAGCCYKMNQTANAVLNYERALRLAPGDDDIRFNLELARAKTVDKVEPGEEFFLTRWVIGITNNFGERTWTIAAIVSFLILLTGIGLYLLSKTSTLRKLGFSLSLISIIVCLTANMAASAQKDKLTATDEAIVMVPSVTVKSTPDEGGTQLFVLHEGHKVKITDDTMSKWTEVMIEDGNKGWLPSEDIEII